MSWTMWHIYGTGFDLEKAEISAYKKFINNHLASLQAATRPEYTNNLLQSLANDDITKDGIRETSNNWSIAEPVAIIMSYETNINFDSPGMTDDGEDCILFTAREPWDYSDTEKALTPETLNDTINKYASEFGLKAEDFDLIYSG